LEIIINVACAQNFPGRPVKIIVPYSAGGTADYSARQIALKLSEMTISNHFLLRIKLEALWHHRHQFCR
jgi:tripartite-type tricarboxylate transporter receptor subunit TctC